MPPGPKVSLLHLPGEHRYIRHNLCASVTHTHGRFFLTDYILVTSGTDCVRKITDLQGCKSAAAQLGFADNTWFDTSYRNSPGLPRDCFIAKYTVGQITYKYLYFNNDENDNTPCNATSGSLHSLACICSRVIEVTSGTCNPTKQLTTLEECKKAANNLGHNGDGAQSVSSGLQPAACSIDANDSVFFNTNSNSVNCGDSSTKCICIA